MDTSYVAVGTVIYMITDSLTCRPPHSGCRRQSWEDVLMPKAAPYTASNAFPVSGSLIGGIVAAGLAAWMIFAGRKA